MRGERARIHCYAVGRETRFREGGTGDNDNDVDGGPLFNAIVHLVLFCWSTSGGHKRFLEVDWETMLKNTTSRENCADSDGYGP